MWELSFANIGTAVTEYSYMTPTSSTLAAGVGRTEAIKSKKILIASSNASNRSAIPLDGTCLIVFQIDKMRHRSSPEDNKSSATRNEPVTSMTFSKAI